MTDSDTPRRRWTDDPTRPIPEPYGLHASTGPVEAPEGPAGGLHRSDWANPRVLAVAAVLAILGGAGVFVLTTALQTGEAVDRLEVEIEGIREFQTAGRERSFRGQALTCEVQDVLGIIHDANGDGEDPCNSPDVLRSYDPNAGRNGQARLACMIAAAATGEITERCALVLADLPVIPPAAG